jgi:hypothetical protein
VLCSPLDFDEGFPASSRYWKAEAGAPIPSGRSPFEALFPDILSYMDFILLYLLPTHTARPPNMNQYWFNLS